MSRFIKDSLRNHAGEALDAKASLDGKVVGLYFSAHWCPPCRGFTPQLKAKYEEIKAAGGNFEIVFVSSDRDAASCAEYYAEMPWLLLDYSDREKKANLSDPMIGFGVSGIPTLVLLDGEGKLITKSGRSCVMNTPFAEWPAFGEAEKKKAEAEKALILSMPAEITHSCHEHTLTKTEDAYGGRPFGCDVCGGDAKGAAFQCRQCGFDAHLSCVAEGYTAVGAAEPEAAATAGETVFTADANA